jgi:uncharacterized protein YndB with AHSA1/START domain
MPTLESAAPETAALLLEQTRIIRASRSRVYEAWTNPEVMQQWFGPVNMACPSAVLDVRTGGSYRIEMRGTLDPAQAQRPNESSAHVTAAVGTYTKVIPNELLQFTWTPEWNPGEQSLVTVSLKDAPGGTEITLRHENLLTESSRDGHTHGWSGCLVKLNQLLEA